MPRILFFICFLLVINAGYSQKLMAFFEKKSDTIKSDSKKELSQKFTIKIPKQEKYKDYKVSFSMSETEFAIPGSEVFLPNEKEIELDNKMDTLKKTFTIKFIRDMNNDRLISLKLKGMTKEGKDTALYDSATSYKIYIKPYIDDSLVDASTDGSEFWLFTGSNLDMLDGPKVKELYFKGSYLLNLKKEDDFTKHWIYITFGKNRFFSDRDSLSRIRFTDVIPDAVPGDSITIAQGYYNTFRLKETNNIFLSFDYLRNIEELSSPKSKLFFTAGFYTGLQTISTSYSGSVVTVADTSNYYFKKDSTYQFRPVARDLKVREFNYNLNIGFMHILSKRNMNVKTQLVAGFNRFDYPYKITSNGISETNQYKSDKGVFMKFRIDGTLFSPGISIGFESFFRSDQIPLFNITFSKVFDLKQLGNLFGKLSTTSN